MARQNHFYRASDLAVEAMRHSPYPFNSILNRDRVIMLLREEAEHHSPAVAKFYLAEAKRLEKHLRDIAKNQADSLH